MLWYRHLWTESALDGRFSVPIIPDGGRGRDPGSRAPKGPTRRRFSLTKWCMREAPREGNFPGHMGRDPSGALFGVSPSILLGEWFRSSDRVGLRRVYSRSYRIRPKGRRCRRGNSRAGPGGKPQESRVGPRGSALTADPVRPWSAGRSISSERGRRKRRKEGAGKPVPRYAGNSSGEAKDPGEHRSPRTFGFGTRDTDPCGEQSPEAAGHRDPLVLRAEERDVRNSKREMALKGVRLREGEKL